MIIDLECVINAMQKKKVLKHEDIYEIKLVFDTILKAYNLELVIGKNVANQNYIFIREKNCKNRNKCVGLSEVIINN